MMMPFNAEIDIPPTVIWKMLLTERQRTNS
jgi:hypothetical protein